MKTLVLTILSVATMVASPLPPWLLDRANSGDFDLNQFSESFASARLRGIDSANPIYGPDNPPFGPNGAISSIDNQMKALIILVDFSDNVAQTEPVCFDSMGFAENEFSLRNYYNEVSQGQIDIITVNLPSSTGWQRNPEPYAYYVDDNFGFGTYPTNSQGMVEDLCEVVDPFIDFSNYDNDEDGFVDGFNVIFAGQFNGTPQTMWPHAWFLTDGGITFDGVKVYWYSVTNEYDNTPGDKSASVLCHEFGHVMGLPDLYDYDYDSNDIGDWCIMAHGINNGNGSTPAHLSAWCRISLGISTPINVTSEGDYLIPAVETSGTVYKLSPGGISSDEYFLVENRRPIGYDNALPGHGLLIWHIDDSVEWNDYQWYPGYTSYGHYHVALEQADGLWEMEQKIGYGNPEDPFPGLPLQNNDTFNYWTTPDSRNYDFQDSYVSVSSIPPSADTVTVHISVNQTGIGNIPSGHEHPGLTLISSGLSIEPVAFELLHSGGEAKVVILDLSGRLVTELWNGQMDAGTHTLSWVPATSNTGVYFARYTSNGSNSSVKFVLLR